MRVTIVIICLVFMDLLIINDALHLTCVVFFSLELGLRMVCYLSVEAEWWRFFCSVFRVIDFSCVAADIIALILADTVGKGSELTDVKIVRVVRIFRMLRFLRIVSRASMVVSFLFSEESLETDHLKEFRETLLDSEQYDKTLKPLPVEKLERDMGEARFALVATAAIMSPSFPLLLCTLILTHSLSQK